MKFREGIDIRFILIILTNARIGICKFYKYILFLYLVLLPSWDALAKVAFFKENAYFNLGIGGFQCDRFKDNALYIKNRPKAALLFTVGAGYEFSRHVRGNVNFQYSKIHYNANDGENYYTQKIRIIAGMFNLDYSIYPKSLVNPYITGGVGISRNNPIKFVETTLPVESKSKATMNFAWNVGCGVLLGSLSQNYSIDVGYRYVDLGKIRTKGFTKKVVLKSQRIKGHQIMVSISFKF